ncbi:glutamate-cysteine ligase 2 family protein [Mycobacterium xenopi 3993]|nr:glutamate-cysteine ligase 2 family protein [Mycobacterium xenopi 3993]
MTSDQQVLRSAFADAGLGLVALGADPLRPAMRVNPGRVTAPWNNSSPPATPELRARP